MNKKTIGMLALGLLLGGGSIGAFQVMAQTNNAAQTPTTSQQQQEVKVDAGNGSVLKTEQDDNEKGGDIEKDGIDHQFEGEEEHTD